MSAAQGEHHVRWPAERFYWAVLEVATVAPFQKKRAEQLGYLLEPLVPEPIEDLHAVYVPIGRRRFVACALPRRVLTGDTNRLESAVTLTPESIPEFVAEKIDVALLNLLTGPFAPAVVRRAHTRWVFHGAALWLIACIFLTVGFERRTAAAKARENQADRAASAVYARVLGDGAGRSSLPPALQLLAELRTLRQTRATDAPVAPDTDAAVTLSDLLAQWPSAENLATESIQVTASSIHVQGTVPTSGHVQAVATAFSPMVGWRLEQPSIQAVADGVHASVELKRDVGTQP